LLKKFKFYILMKLKFKKRFSLNIEWKIEQLKKSYTVNRKARIPNRK
jgi:hypothetical protein